MCLVVDILTISTHAAFCNDVLVGAIAVRLERQPSGKVQLYIVTLGVLAAYRNYGVGKPPLALLASVPLQACKPVVQDGNYEARKAIGVQAAALLLLCTHEMRAFICDIEKCALSFEDQLLCDGDCVEQA